MAEPTVIPNFFERHRAKIAFAGAGDCWLWTGYCNPDGYGHVGARGKVRKAHREAYEAGNGPSSADGLVVRHRCDVRNCVNPSHLEVGTQADNIRDREERGRRRGGTSKGEANGQARLTEDEVKMIRALYVRGSRDLGQHALARKFGVSHALIGTVVRRERWQHVA